MSKKIPFKDFTLTPKSNTIICNIATAHYKDLRDIMEPTVIYYGNLHQIDTLLLTEGLVPERPAAWDRIVLLYNLLRFYEIVIWLDADTVIVDPRIDIRCELDSCFPVQMVTHFSRVPIFPNTGVWVAKRDHQTEELLEAVWNQTGRINHQWWEQQAVLDLLGFVNNYHSILAYNGPTKYSSMIGLLDIKWNSRPMDQEIAESPVIMHYCGIHPFDKRLEEMKKGYNAFLQRIGRISS